MRNFIYFLIIAFTIISCGTSNTKNTSGSKNDMEEAVVIANDSLEYELIILDIGFDYYLNSIAKPVEFYTQDYLEVKNNFYVIEWNIRATNPFRYGDLYGNQIDYFVYIDYGMEVNYLLYNYFKFFERKYRVRLR